MKSQINIQDGRIASINDNNNIVEIIGEDYKLSFPPTASAYPGFVDSHGHVAGYGMRLSEIDLSAAESFAECMEIAKSANLVRGNWIVGYGWNQENWQDKSMPTAEALDSVFSDTPVFFLRADAHSAIVNSVAMKLADISRFTHQPEGGLIVLDKAGNPTGLLIDNAVNIVSSHVPDYSLAQYSAFIERAVHELPKYGITEVHDMDVDIHLIPIYQFMEIEKKLPIRIMAYAKAQNNEWLRDNLIAYSANMYSVKGLKYFVDGALGSRGAALLRHYEDDPATDGVLLLDQKKLFMRAKRGVLSGFDIAIHVIGDRACRLALDAIEDLRKDPMLKGSGNFRLEHAQVIHPDDLPRFKKLGVTASVQPIHFTTDTREMAPKRLGGKMQYSYLWKTLLQSGVDLIAGSDFPIESPSPIEGIRAFLHRIPSGSQESLYPNERVSLKEAIDAYTLAPAKATGNSLHRGELSRGKQADITILSDSLRSLEQNPNAEISVLATIVNGKVAYCSAQIKQ